MEPTKLKNTELFLFDMDGTLYLGDNVYEGAIELMEDLPRLGKKYIYLTNNSSRAGEDYITRLRRLGFPCERENVFTSGMATGMYLNQRHPGASVYLAGTKAFYRELQSYAAFIAANPDWVCPMPHDEVLPDCGSICALLTASSGVKPNYIGKPNRNMIDVISEMTGIPNEKICAVGDRLYTDIAVAQNAGSVSVLVLSGETDQAMVDAAEREPDYVLRDVHELHEILKSI